MDKTAFLENLKKNNIDTNIVCFNDNITDDVFCVIENYNTVEIFYRERGSKYNVHYFSSLSEALIYLLNWIISMS